MEFVGMALVIIGLVLATAIFFLPTIIAFKRGHASKFGIFVLNFFLGATVLFWVLALIWSLSNKGQPQQVIIYNNQQQTGEKNV